MAGSDFLWHMRDIRFDVDSRMLKLIDGEVLIDKIENVEDTKGNNGDRGVMRITNLRLIWHAMSMPRINLSIGYSCLVQLKTNTVISKVRGTECEALYVFAKAPGTESKTRFEFIFTASATGNHSRMFNTLHSVHRAYETTKLYREMKMRGAVLDENEQLKMLPLENIVDRIEGVWNLSQDQGTLGVFILTNIRICFYGKANPLFNCSVPYLQLSYCRMRDSKFGIALVLETSTASGEYVLGFRVDPQERLVQVTSLIQSLHKTARNKPIYGVQVSRELPPAERSAEDEPLDHVEDDVEIDEKPLRTDAFAAYFSAGTAAVNDGSRPSNAPVFSEELGLAIEPLKPGFTISDLWNVHLE